MKIAAIVCAALLLAAWLYRRFEVWNAIDSAALDLIYPMLPNIPRDFLSPTRDEVDSAQKRLDELLEWANKIIDPRLRRACRRWINYFMRDVRAARKEVRTKRKARSMERFEASQNRAAARRDRIIAKHLPNIPTLPEAEV